MFLINVHQLDIVLAKTIGVRTLKDHVDNIWSIFGLQCEDIVVLCGSEDFGEGGEVDAERNVPIATEGSEHLSFEHHRDQRNVGVVHSLESDSGVIAIEVAVLNQVFDRVDDLQRCQLWQRDVDEFELPFSGFLTSQGVPLTLFTIVSIAMEGQWRPFDLLMEFGR